ncbi:L-threonylcarbamoyladenylate synthase [Blattabacterium cuenoti]|uniref:L-threonylcarbamoyladenylate synthase n=1 Tax=Blattabacterium cuenoti TaxID=1653831 RepID=UPI00163BC2E2|nr:L-threonylcarbamoyladenylate synthase [Blattabacterium cuenoti]
MSFQIEITKSINFLKRGKILLYPTDTVWGLGCDAFNINAINKIYKIKKRNSFKPMIFLVESINRLQNLVGKLSDFTKQIILENYKKKPITIIYQFKKNYKNKTLYKLSYNKTLAVRLTYDIFCSNLIKKLNKPIISTSANISGCITPKSFSEIDPQILKNVDYIVNFRRKEKSVYDSSKIIKINSNKIKILRF